MIWLYNADIFIGYMNVLVEQNITVGEMKLNRIILKEKEGD